MLFVNGTTVSKGDAFLSFLKKTGLSPKIIFIDDKEDNLKSLEVAIQKLDYPMEYQGLHFLGLKNIHQKLFLKKNLKQNGHNLLCKLKNLIN